MAKSKRPRYRVQDDHLFQHSVLHKTTGNFFVVPDEITFYASANPDVTKLRVGSANETVCYECDIEQLLSHIEDEMFEMQVREDDGQEGFLIPVDSGVFRKIGGVDKSNDSAWERVKKDIIESSGGYWSQEQQQAWKDKFAASSNPKNKPVTGWYARVK
jgi:hypothetical protein